MLEKKLLFDKRIVNRNIKKGLVTQKELEKELSGLADLQGSFSDVEIAVEEGEFDLRAPEPSPDAIDEDEFDD